MSTNRTNERGDSRFYLLPIDPEHVADLLASLANTIHPAASISGTVHDQAPRLEALVDEESGGIVAYVLGGFTSEGGGLDFLLPAREGE